MTINPKLLDEMLAGYQRPLVVYGGAPRHPAGARARSQPTCACGLILSDLVNSAPKIRPSAQNKVLSFCFSAAVS